jgi:hypothetical protein
MRRHNLLFPSKYLQTKLSSIERGDVRCLPARFERFVKHMRTFKEQENGDENQENGVCETRQHFEPFELHMRPSLMIKIHRKG